MLRTSSQHCVYYVIFKLEIKIYHINVREVTKPTVSQNIYPCKQNSIMTYRLHTTKQNKTKKIIFLHHMQYSQFLT